MKVMTVVGTRPEVIRLSETIKVLDKQFEHVLVHTGQNYDYELNAVFFKELGLRSPDFFLSAAGSGPIETIASILVKIDELFAIVEPDALLVLGDTNSALCVYPAKRRKIPIFHVEAGNRCFDFRVPEEINRRIVDHISDVNLTYSEHARRYLIAEGLPPDRVIKIGSPLAEVINKYRIAASESTVVAQLRLVRGRFILISAHREENVDSRARLTSLFACINSLSDQFDCDLLMSLHPRTAARLKNLNITLHPRLKIMKPFGFIDYLALQMGAACVVSDSGSVTEEASILSVPAVTIRQAHERPEGMDEGTVVMADLDPKRVVMAVKIALGQFSEFGAPRLVPDYDVPQVSWKIAKIIGSYTDFVGREVWKKL